MAPTSATIAKWSVELVFPVLFTGIFISVLRGLICRTYIVGSHLLFGSSIVDFILALQYDRCLELLPEKYGVFSQHFFWGIGFCSLAVAVGMILAESNLERDRILKTFLKPKALTWYPKRSSTTDGIIFAGAWMAIFVVWFFNVYVIIFKGWRA